LLKLAAGIHQSDSGKMTFDGKPFRATSYIDATMKGVAYVFQETTINPFLSVAENIYINRLGEFKNKFGLIDFNKLNSMAQAVLDDIGADFTVKDKIQNLNLGQWKIIEIARGLSYDPKAIFFDESTAFLNYNEAKSFARVILNLKKKNMIIGIVTHHLNEIFEMADTASVMKDGKWVADKVIKETTLDELQQLMVGRSITTIYPQKRKTISDELVLEVEGISEERVLKDVSFSLHKGEVLGIGGLKGSGGDEILGALFGDIKLKKGNIRLDGNEYSPKSPNTARMNKVSLLPGERTIEGLIPSFSIKDNINMGALKRKGILLDTSMSKEIANDLIKKITIKTSSCEAPCNSLSGGNMQKVVIAKCLATNPNILLLNNPTRGIDVGARLEIYTIISKLAEEGMSIIMLSEDLSELIGMSDRIIILKQGRISKLYEHGEEQSEEDIIKYML
jgi:ABC-type sugar transport system ATPase subunit